MLDRETISSRSVYPTRNDVRMWWGIRWYFSIAVPCPAAGLANSVEPCHFLSQGESFLPFRASGKDLGGCEDAVVVHRYRSMCQAAGLANLIEPTDLGAQGTFSMPFRVSGRYFNIAVPCVWSLAWRIQWSQLTWMHVIPRYLAFGVVAF